MDKLRVKRHGRDIVEYEVLSKGRTLSRDLCLVFVLICLAQWARSLKSRLLWIWLALLIAYTLSSLSRTISQSIILLPPHGLQLSSRSMLGHKVLAFLPAHRISDVLIHEGIRGFGVKYYLAILVNHGGHGSGSYDLRIVVPFENMNTGLDILVEIYHASREALFDDYETDSDGMTD